ncbi:MAG: chorismate-binding protein [Proteobacteria bacterium]|nr:chorismate-binding protein [Pseudomonadota bacterium]
MKYVVLHDADAHCWHHFSAPFAVLETFDLHEVMETIQAVEERVLAEQLYAVGFISYEAAPAFDAACTVHYSAGFPLVRFGLFRAPEVMDELPSVFDCGESGSSDSGWQFDTSAHRYSKKIETIRSHIRAGDCYQVNYTIRQHRCLTEDPRILFASMAVDAAYAAYIECDDFTICSASPELFFELDRNRLTARPMKGTAPRGDTPEEDRRLAEWLMTSEKNRAENLMIVDMIRQDIGRIAQPGSVAVDNLFTVETHPTVLQMTSTVTATTRCTIAEILQALFPCASITGATDWRRTVYTAA